jgi:hypothetical protein
MNDIHQPAEVVCISCGATNAPWDTQCWLCKHPLGGGGKADDSVVLAQAVPVQTQFGLSTILLVITVLCICLGLISVAPGLIVPLVVIVAPALVRTAVATRLSSGPVSVGDKIATFSASLGIIVLIWIAGLVAFGTACTLIVIGGASMNFSNDAIGFLLLLGVCAALGAFAFMIWLLYKSWPRNNKPK